MPFSLSTEYPLAHKASQSPPLSDPPPDATYPRGKVRSDPGG